jgi:hypothetical protein
MHPNRVAAQLLLLIFTVTVSAVQTRTVPARTIPADNGQPGDARAQRGGLAGKY